MGRYHSDRMAGLVPMRTKLRHSLPDASSQCRLCTSLRLKMLRPRLSALKSMPTCR